MSDPLSVNLSTKNAQTAIPLFQDKTPVHLRLISATQETSDKGPFLKFKYELTQPAPSNQSGKTILPGGLGSIFFENIQLYSKPDAKDPTWFVAKISSRIDALLGTGDPGNAHNKPERPELFAPGATLQNPVIDAALLPNLLGKELVATMSIDEYQGNLSNNIKKATFPADFKG